LANKKKYIIKQKNYATTLNGTNSNQQNSIILDEKSLNNVGGIYQENYIKQYSFNPFQPFETKINTQYGVIKIKKK